MHKIIYLFFLLLLAGCAPTPEANFSAKLEIYLDDIEKLVSSLAQSPDDLENAKKLFTGSLKAHNKLPAVPTEMQTIKVDETPLSQAIRSTSDALKKASAVIQTLELCEPDDTQQIDSCKAKVQNIIADNKKACQSIRDTVRSFMASR
ncbi:MAG: hypothetical protein VX438_06260 [Planctomycetota bacterium]|nr:hypothetical protein [Planctomycetota bacterium]